MSDVSSTGTPYPGSRLGLPADGPGSVASWGRRIAALVLDWFASLAVAAAVLGGAVWGQGWEAWAPLGVFALESGVLTALMGGSFGQLLLRIVVVRVDGKPVGLLQALGRAVLICLVVPPLIFNRDNRGLHDLAFKTIVLQR